MNRIKYSNYYLIFTLFVVSSFYLGRAAALHKAACEGNVEKVQQLLNNHADVNEQNSQGCTPLHEAVRCNKTAIVTLLLADKNINVNVQDAQGYTPLYDAVIRYDDRIDIARLLLAHKDIDVNKQYEKGNRLLDLVINRTDKQKVKDDEEIVKVLLQKDADITKRDSSGCTPLHNAAKQGKVGIVRLLLEKRAVLKKNDYINEKNTEGKTPLRYAVQHNKLDVATLLLQNNADVHQADKGDNTPLHQAAQGSNPDMVKVLLQYKADPTAKNKAGITPFHHAEKNSNPTILARLQQGPDHPQPPAAAQTIFTLKNVIIGSLIVGTIVGALSYYLRKQKEVSLQAPVAEKEKV